MADGTIHAPIKVGDRFDRLEVIGRGEPHQRRSGALVSTWRCRCNCNKVLDVLPGNLRSGNTASCGCLRTERMAARSRKHEGKGSPTYISWINMRQRCNNPNHPDYPAYGGRGIRVCGRWDSFAAFLCDVGERPSLRHSIGRVDNNGDYEPPNCRWETQTQQSRNQRTSRFLEYAGLCVTLAEWGERRGISSNTIRKRLNRGWTAAKALGF